MTALGSRTAALAMVVSAALAAAQVPGRAWIRTGVVATSQATGFVLNAYPVLDRLRSGRLVCIFAVETAVRPRKMNIAASVSDDGGATWSRPEIVFDHPNAEDADPNLLATGNEILAFSTTVPEPERIDHTLIYMRASRDGIHWGPETLLKTPHRYIAGKIHQGHRLADGTLIMGYAWDTWADQGMDPATEGEMNIKAGVLRSTDGGKTWQPGADLYAEVAKTSPHATSGLDEPATVVLADGRVMTLMRAAGRRLYQAWSRDGGMNWSAPRPSQLTAHNSPAALWRLDGSRDVAVVWDDSATQRTPLAAALSRDGGKSWMAPRVIADTHSTLQVSYPSVCQARDGTLVAVWQQDLPGGGREIRVARFNRAWLLGEH